MKMPTQTEIAILVEQIERAKRVIKLQEEIRDDSERSLKAIASMLGTGTTVLIDEDSVLQVQEYGYRINKLTRLEER